MANESYFDLSALSPRQFCEAIFIYIIARAEAVQAKRRTVRPGTLAEIRAKTGVPEGECARTIFYKLFRSQQGFIDRQAELLAGGSSNYGIVKQETEALTARLYEGSSEITVVEPLVPDPVPSSKPSRPAKPMAAVPSKRLEAELYGVKFKIGSNAEAELFAYVMAKLKRLEVI